MCNRIEVSRSLGHWLSGSQNLSDHVDHRSSVVISTLALFIAASVQDCQTTIHGVQK